VIQYQRIRNAQLTISKYYRGHKVACMRQIMIQLPSCSPSAIEVLPSKKECTDYNS